MANIVNNVNLDKTTQTAEAGRKDKQILRRPVKLQGEWILDSSSGYQFRTEMQFEKGKQVIEIDSPSFLGGDGNRLGPMAYCVAGITSCFIGTLATVAANQGVRLAKLSVETECSLNFAKTFDVEEKPITEGITFRLDIQSDNADRDRLQKLIEMAKERCPAVYSMSHQINVNAQIK